ncbi:MAG: Plug and carboxypeptidase regulatory-like domain-containing protein, partial [Acidobacteriota bacterium]|nr:Plug and carboxypeptidase regulatory-like domain-containing protein [Acidobacteriota bacterium]
MIRRSVRLVCLATAIALLTSVPAFAQASSVISGTVLDSAGGAIPGATVIARNPSGVTYETVSNAEGVFSIPAVAAGTYTVTVSLTGFKTSITENLSVVPGRPSSVKAVLEVGQVSENVTVMSSTELINTQSATVSATLNSDQLNALTFLPGVNTSGTNRNSTVNGLPDSFMNISLDGVSNNDQFLRSSDGFFASVTPRQDAIEAVTVTTAVGTAQTGGSGAINVNFVTRSGSNRFSGTAYDYLRHTSMNTNYWFNERNSLPRNDVKLYQWGGRASGPLSVPGLFDGRDKAFYMVHYEQLRFPNSFTRTRGVLHPRVLDGWFRYTDGDALREVNVLTLARANGQIATLDPLMLDIMQRIQAATATTGTVSATSNPLINDYVWQSPGKLFEHQPTVRLDYNVTPNHRLSGSAQFIKAQRDPDYLNGVDARFPGAPNYRLFTSTRPLYSTSLRSTLSQRIVNEVQFGITQGGASYFGDDSSNGPQTFADQNGMAIVTPLATADWHATNAPSWRSSWTYSLGNTLNWQKGSHALSVGGEMLFVRAWENAKQVVPQINLGFSQTNDPARAMFNLTNFPGASAAELNEARAIYAQLTGRVSSIGGQAALDPDTGEYVAFAPRERAGKMDTHSLFIQDAWRATPTLTLNAGVRWSVQLPFTAENGTMTTITMADACGLSGLGDGGPYSRCNFGTPGASGGIAPTFKQFETGSRGYETDWNNFAPNVGVAWRPNVQDGFLRAFLGDPDQATLRAGYSIAYDRVGMSSFTGVYGVNQGSTLSLSRTEAQGNLVLPGETWPVLLSQTSRLNPQPFPLTPTYPIALRAGAADSLNGFAPDLQVANAHSWTASFQRALSRDMAVDFRYVGTRGVDQWSSLDYNARDIEGNGFINEFKAAMGNLRANNQAGGSRAGSFAYFGANTGTSPLPVYLA